MKTYTHETLERQLADEHFGRSLVLSDFTKSDHTGFVADGLLDTNVGKTSFFSR